MGIDRPSPPARVQCLLDAIHHPNLPSYSEFLAAYWRQKPSVQVLTTAKQTLKYHISRLCITVDPLLSFARDSLALCVALTNPQSLVLKGEYTVSVHVICCLPSHDNTSPLSDWPTNIAVCIKKPEGVAAVISSDGVNWDSSSWLFIIMKPIRLQCLLRENTS